MNDERTVQHPWDSREYADMTSLAYGDRRLTVTFADGASVELDVKRLGAYGIAEEDWSRAVIDDEVIAVPGSSGLVEIPWDVIRSLTDPAFDDYIGERADEAARAIGAKFRWLRQRRNLSLAEVASRTKMAPLTIERFEAGLMGSTFDFDERLLAAIGCDEDDLYPVEPAALGATARR